MDYYGLMLPTLRIWHLALTSAFALGPVSAQPQPAPALAPSAAPTDNARPLTEQDLHSALNAELFFELLVGEMSASQGDWTNATALLMSAARETQNEDLFRRAAELAMQSRSGPRALSVAKEWTGSFPESREANRFALQTLVMLNRVSETQDYLSQEVRTTPVASKASVYLAIAQLYSRVSDKALAAAVVEQALQPDLEDRELGPHAWSTIGHMRLLAQQSELALQAAQHAYTLNPSSSATALLALELMESEVLGTEHMVQDYLQQQPTAIVRSAYARVLMGMGRYRDAEAQAQQLILQEPDNADAWLIQAQLQAHTKDWTAALQSLRQFESLAQYDPETSARSQLQTQAALLGARIALQSKAPEQALQWLAKAPESADPLEVQSLKALAFARMGKLAHGRALIRALPARTPEQELLKRRAEVNLLRDAGAPQEAYLLQLTLHEQDPDDADLAYDTALLAERAGKLHVMERMLRKIIKQHPDHYHSHNALGYSFADRGIHLQEARTLIETALSHAPDDPFITDSLGWLEFKQGNAQKALAILEKAYGLRDDVEIAAHLGEVLWSLGEQQRAQEIFKAALQKDASNEALQSTLERLNIQP